MIVFKFNKTRLRISFNLLGKINITRVEIDFFLKSKKKNSYFVFMKSENCRMRLVFQTKGIVKPTPQEKVNL